VAFRPYKSAVQRGRDGVWTNRNKIEVPNIVCARYNGSLMILALCFTSWNLIGGLAQLLWVKRLLPWLRLTAQLCDGNLAKMLVQYTLALAVLYICMILISNVDLKIDSESS
jgi:hypothetical protein